MMWTTRPRSDVSGVPAIVTGSGPDVLCLHGVGLRAEAWAAQFALPARIIAPDMLGHGACERSGHALDMQSFVKNAAEVLDRLDGPVIVIGHSMGAMLAVELALRAPNKVCAVAALNAVFERSAAASSAVIARAAKLDGVTVPDQTQTLERWFGDHASPERNACEGWLTAVDPASYKNAYAAFAYSQIPDRKRLSELSCPALFMTGELEENSTPEMSRSMAECAPLGRAHVVEGAAHMMPMTHPTEVNETLTTFLKEVSP